MKNLIIALLFTAFSFGQDSIPDLTSQYVIINKDYVLTPHESSIDRFGFESQIFHNNIIIVGEEKFLIREVKEGGWLLTPLDQIDYDIETTF